METLTILTRRIEEQERLLEVYRGALDLIAAPKRNDGTYNRSREACEQLAKQALTSHRSTLSQKGGKMPKCITCGSQVRVVGNTTLHYEPEELSRRIEEQERLLEVYKEALKFYAEFNLYKVENGNLMVARGGDNRVGERPKYEPIHYRAIAALEAGAARGKK